MTFGDKRADIARTEGGPFGSLQREIDRVFDDFSRNWPALGGGGLTPRMDVTERDGTIEIAAELPGLEEKDVEVSVVDNILTVKGEKKAERTEEEGARKLVERSYGAFARTIELPPGIKAEDIKASLSKGVLTVTLPKPVAAAPQAKKIEVKAG
ncbi:Hsp20/alpha crystallin family protein [Xanthobacter sp. KR7-225]|uniref:Hsp20/alpha crystallin family protein n=1 Tax=Xanthobacter sp. KR7-225 TaxID=3156613 RepID=UPI0032B54457